MAKARRRDWIFAGIAVAAALAVAVALVIRLTDDDEGASLTRTTPWKKLRTLPDIGTLSYSCGFPGRQTATRLSVPRTGGNVNAQVDFGGEFISARIEPGGRLGTPYGPFASFSWTAVRNIKQGKIEVAVPVSFQPEPGAGRSSCPKPEFTVSTVRPKGS
jgi:hypothetical protein